MISSTVSKMLSFIIDEVESEKGDEVNPNVVDNCNKESRESIFCIIVSFYERSCRVLLTPIKIKSYRESPGINRFLRDQGSQFSSLLGSAIKKCTSFTPL